ncbi:MAG: flagellar basal-body rod protein FlgG [Myxococcota bacterium]|nr:flagellar basal-body rod protein FlgG [Myxococcota bacterium]
MKALYTAATGMSAQQTQLDNIANNMANVGTTGFKRSSVAFQDLYYQEVTGGGIQGDAQGTVRVGSGTKVVGNYRNHKAGTMVTTSSATDMAIEGRGYFKVMDQDGNEFYTRDGSFQLSSEGELITNGGLVVQGVGAVSPDMKSLVVNDDGEVLETLSDNSVQSLGIIEVADFANPGGLSAVGGNLFQASNTSGEATQLTLGTGETTVNQYMLEGSNVDVAVELIDMIQAQRAFELTSKVIQASDEALQTTANLKR